MTKFCTQCGRKLKEGEVCDCKQNQANNQTITITMPNISSYEIGKKISSILKGILIKPIDTIKENVKGENFSVALIFVLISSFFTSLFTLAYIKNTVIVTNSQLQASLYNAFSNRGNMVTDVPYAKYFFTTLVISVVVAFVFTGAMYLINKAFKGKGDFKEVFTLYGIVSTITAFTTLIASILVFVNLTLSLFVLIFGSLLTLIYLYHGLKFIGPNDQNKYGYIYILSAITTTIIITILTNLIAK